MNQLDALKKMCDHYPGGRAALAVRLDKSDEVLRKELAGDPKFKMGIVDASAISEMCIEVQSQHCYAFVNAVNGNAGRLLELPVRDMVAKQDLRGDMAGMLKECSDVFQGLTVALADDTISDNERRAIEKELGELAEKVQTIHRGVRANNEASKPFLRAA